jgi:hypothetical protein
MPVFLFDFCRILDKNLLSDKMKNVIKSLFAILLTSSAFFIGFYLGKEKIRTKIPKFQEDLEERT